MEARLVICAQSLSIDQRSNAVSLFHVVEELSSPSFPTVIPYMVLVALLSRRADEPNIVEDLNLSIEVDGDQILETVLKAANFQQMLHSKVVVDMQGIVINKPGDLRIVVSRAKQPLGAWNIRVNNIGPTINQEPGT